MEIIMRPDHILGKIKARIMDEYLAGNTDDELQQRRYLDVLEDVRNLDDINNPQPLLDDYQDEPEEYSYTQHDLDTFIFAYYQ